MTYSQAPNHFLTARNGVEYAYRDTGHGTIPLVLLQRFRGNLDDWDPALVDALAVALIGATGLGVATMLRPGPGLGLHLHLPAGYPVIFGLFFVWLVAGTLLILKVRRRAA